MSSRHNVFGILKCFGKINILLLDCYLAAKAFGVQTKEQFLYIDQIWRQFPKTLKAILFLGRKDTLHNHHLFPSIERLRASRSFIAFGI